MPYCSVVIPCRDGEKTIGKTLETLLNQDISVDICVANDHSVDSTLDIIRLHRVKSVTYPTREPRNYHRVPVLINMASRHVERSRYYMVSGDDTQYPRTYIRRVIEYMEKEETDIASGYSVQYGYKSRNNAPGGSGRIYNLKAWGLCTPFYPNIAWESGALYKALLNGYKLGFYPIPKSHVNPQLVSSTYTFGYGAYCLGTPLTYTLLRVLKTVFNNEHSIWNGLSILLGQIEYELRRPFRVDLAPEFKLMKQKLMGKTVKRAIRKTPIIGKYITWLINK